MKRTNKRKAKKKSINNEEIFLNHKKRKRSITKEKQTLEENELKIFPSNEAYERKSIFDFSEVPLYYPNFNDYNHFERKKIVENYFKQKNGQYTFDELLFLDDTNKDLQISYIEKIVDKINNEKDIERIKIYEEKILKSQIIIDENTYNKIISKINDKKLKEKLVYINYKLSLKNSLQCLLENNNENEDNVLKAKEALKLSKIFNFNKWSEMGENNFYFYRMCYKLFNKIDEIADYYSFYEDIIKEMIEFLEKEDFDKLDEDKIFRFNYISFIILDKKSMISDDEYNKINDFLKGEKIKKKDLKNLFKKGVKYEYNKIKNFKFKVKYNSKKNKIYFKMIENRKINKKKFSYSLIKSYKADMFNKNISDFIEKYLTPNFDSNIMETILPLRNTQLAFYDSIKSAFEENLKKILKSEAAKKFFKNTYGKKYPDLIYHFDRDDVINEIIKKINFFPIFKENDNGFTNDVDMSIIINSIPGKIGEPKTHSFNRKFLNLGMILVIALHEIFGHYMRRYYSLLTGRIIDFSTPKNNKDSLTGKESGYFIKHKFLGMEPGVPNIGLKKCLSLLYFKNLQDYPIFKKEGFEINIDVLKQIYNDNPTLFNFIISEEKDKEDNNNDEDKENKDKKDNSEKKDKEDNSENKNKKEDNSKNEDKKEDNSKYEDKSEHNSENEDEEDNIEDKEGEENSDDSEEDYLTKGIISLEDYLDTLITVNDLESNSFRHSHHDEVYFIHFNKFNDYYKKK